MESKRLKFKKKGYVVFKDTKRYEYVGAAYTLKDAVECANKYAAANGNCYLHIHLFKQYLNDNYYSKKCETSKFTQEVWLKDLRIWRFVKLNGFIYRTGTGNFTGREKHSPLYFGHLRQDVPDHPYMDPGDEW